MSLDFDFRCAVPVAAEWIEVRPHEHVDARNRQRPEIKPLRDLPQVAIPRRALAGEQIHAIAVGMILAHRQPPDQLKDQRGDRPMICTRSSLQPCGATVAKAADECQRSNP